MLSRIQTLLRYHIFYMGTFLFSVYWRDGESVSLVLERGGGSKQKFLDRNPKPLIYQR